MSDYTNKTKEELSRLVAEKREALRVFRFAMAGGKVKDVREGGKIRKEIARILTAHNAQKHE